MTPGDSLPVSELVYTMEQQEDGSWRMTGEYELPVSMMLIDSPKKKGGHFSIFLY